MVRYSNFRSLHRRGTSLIGILVSMGILVVLFVIVSQMMTGTGTNPGVKQNTNRKINAIQLNEVYRGFQIWAMDHKDKFPSTKTVPSMEDDTTHQVFKALVEDGIVASQHLMSLNEHETGYYQGYANDFGPKNSSFALNDYDADDWLRYPQWGIANRTASAFLSDRWVEIDGYEYNNINDTFWYVLFTDGHSENVTEPELKNGDELFWENDRDFGDRDVLMAHD